MFPMLSLSEWGREGQGEARRGLQQGRADLGQRNSHIDIGDREEAGLAIQRSLKPVLVNPLREGDVISFTEAQFSWIFRLEVIQSYS